MANDQSTDIIGYQLRRVYNNGRRPADLSGRGEEVGRKLLITAGYTLQRVAEILIEKKNQCAQRNRNKGE